MSSSYKVVPTVPDYIEKALVSLVLLIIYILLNLLTGFLQHTSVAVISVRAILGSGVISLVPIVLFGTSYEIPNRSHSGRPLYLITRIWFWIWIILFLMQVILNYIL